MNKIYCFLNVVSGGEGSAIAIADDGTILGEHWCSKEAFVPFDLGVVEGTRPDRHKTYQKHFPNGYEMEFVETKDVNNHALLQEAFRLHQSKKSGGM